jgi:hypothetical protein
MEIMTSQEKILYHQIHPVKLLTDWLIGGLVSSIFFWRHQFWWGLFFFLVPSIVVSILIISFTNLEKYRLTPLGRYFGSFMGNRWSDAVRFLGAILVAAGAWQHQPIVIVAGVVVVLAVWLRGWFLLVIIANKK